jgi:hypothetical protein
LFRRAREKVQNLEILENTRHTAAFGMGSHENIQRMNGAFRAKQDIFGQGRDQIFVSRVLQKDSYHSGVVNFHKFLSRVMTVAFKRFSKRENHVSRFEGRATTFHSDGLQWSRTVWNHPIQWHTSRPLARSTARRRTRYHNHWLLESMFGLEFVFQPSV